MRRPHLDRRAEAELEALIKERCEDATLEALIARDDPERAKAAQTITARRPADWQNLIEQRIQSAIAQGAFDNLQGAGKPLNLDDDLYVANELKMGYRMLRSSGLAPLWIEMNKEIRDDLERLRRFREYAHESWPRINATERERLRTEYRERIGAINKKIADHNLMAPTASVHFTLLVESEEVHRFDQLS